MCVTFIVRFLTVRFRQIQSTSNNWSSALKRRSCRLATYSRLRALASIHRVDRRGPSRPVDGKGARLIQADPGPLLADALALPAPQIGANLPRRDGSAPRSRKPVACAAERSPYLPESRHTAPEAVGRHAAELERPRRRHGYGPRLVHSEPGDGSEGHPALRYVGLPQLGFRACWGSKPRLPFNVLVGIAEGPSPLRWGLRTPLGDCS